MFASHSSVEGTLGCLHFLDFVNTKVVNMTDEVSVQWDVKSFGHILKSDIAGLYGRLIFTFLIFALNKELQATNHFREMGN